MHTKASLEACPTHRLTLLRPLSGCPFHSWTVKVLNINRRPRTSRRWTCVVPNHLCFSLPFQLARRMVRPSERIAFNNGVMLSLFGHNLGISCFGVKSIYTLHKRLGSFRLYITWAKGQNLSAFPLDEKLVWTYLQHIKDQGLAAS